MKLYLLCLLFLATQSLVAQDGTIDIMPIDSALVWLNDNYIDNPQDFHERALTILERAYQEDDDRLKGEAHLLLLRWHAYYVPFTMDSVYYHGEKAKVCFEHANDLSGLAAAMVLLGFEYVDQNDVDRAEELIFEAVDIYEALEDRQGILDCYIKLSKVFRDQKSPELAIRYALDALEIAQDLEDHYSMAMSYMRLIRAYHENGELEKGIEAADNCIETVNRFVPEERFLLARGYSFRGDIWSDLGDYQKSLEDNTKSYTIVVERMGGEKPATQTYRSGIGYAYFYQKEYMDAIPHLTAAIGGYKDLGQDRGPTMQKLHETLAGCYYHLGDYKKAYLNQELAHSVFDTLMQKRIVNMENEALFKYESGKKDLALAEQEIIIQQNARIQWMGAGLISLLLLFLGTLFYYFRRNKKTSDALFLKNQENELLLKEIHHRVKNNLQTISSLLSLQSESISDKSALDAVQESRNRVASMALIHQKLYQGENLAAIEMRDYFETIGRAIKESFGKKTENVTLKIDMSEVELDVDTAIPIGLITNELITNSLKHAFPENQKGEILISMKMEKDGLLRLLIADNGQSSPAGSDTPGEKGFGSMLTQLLTIQLGGSLEKSTESGTSTIIHFPLQKKSVA